MRFKDYGISTIIIIDDIYNEINEDDLLSDFPPEVIEELTNGEYDKYKDYSISKFISETGEDTFIADLSNEINKSNAYSWLGVEENNIDFKKIGVNDITKVKQKLKDIKSDDKSRKHLIVLDRKLQEDVAGKKNDEIFIEILKTIHSLIGEKNLLLLIYTNEPTPNDLNNFKDVKKHLEKIGLDESASEYMALHFNYVQKSAELSSEFFENILKSQKANYIQKYNEIFRDSYSKLTERLWELNQNHTLFFYDYLNEGKHADEILYNIFLTKFNQEYSEKFSLANGHATLINPIRRSMQRCVQEFDKETEIYRMFKNLDMGIHSNNRIIKVSDSTDISFGDIVEIDNRMFMVLSQDCDIVVRNDFTRKIDNFQLVEIEEKKDPVSEQWLSNFLKKKLKQNMGDEIVKSELRKYGLSDEQVKKITNKNMKKEGLSTEQINNLKYTNELKSKAKSIVSIKCIWLDLLVLRRNPKEEILLTKDNINNSHEIRFATKNYIEKELDELIKIIGNDTQKNEADKIIKFGFGGLNINCESEFSKKQGQLELIGFKIKGIKRKGRLDRLQAMRILKSVLEDKSRIPDIYTPLI